MPAARAAPPPEEGARTALGRPGGGGSEPPGKKRSSLRELPSSQALEYPAPMRLLLKWLLHALALLAVTYLYSGVQVSSFTSALIAAAVIGLLNMIVRPVLVVLTLPVTVVTLGLFLFVINALMFWAASGLLNGFVVAGFVAALIGSLIYSLLGVVIDAALSRG